LIAGLGLSPATQSREGSRSNRPDLGRPPPYPGALWIKPPLPAAASVRPASTASHLARRVAKKAARAAKKVASLAKKAACMALEVPSMAKKAARMPLKAPSMAKKAASMAKKAPRMMVEGINDGEKSGTHAAQSAIDGEKSGSDAEKSGMHGAESGNDDEKSGIDAGQSATRLAFSDTRPAGGNVAAGAGVTPRTAVLPPLRSSSERVHGPRGAFHFLGRVHQARCEPRVADGVRAGAGDDLLIEQPLHHFLGLQACDLEGDHAGG
jgi:hypothetical protein